MNGKRLTAWYKERLSRFRQWSQLSHAEEYLLFPENMGESLSIDETCLSCGEVYTFLTNKAGRGGRGTLVAVVRGTRAEDVTAVLKMISHAKRCEVREVTLDLSSSMMPTKAQRIPQGKGHQRPLPRAEALLRRGGLSCASACAGWRGTWRTRKSGGAGKGGRSTCRSVMPTATRADNCSPAPSTY